MSLSFLIDSIRYATDLPKSTNTIHSQGEHQDSVYLLLSTLLRFFGLLSLILGLRVHVNLKDYQFELDELAAGYLQHDIVISSENLNQARQHMNSPTRSIPPPQLPSPIMPGGLANDSLLPGHVYHDEIVPDEHQLVEEASSAVQVLDEPSSSTVLPQVEEEEARRLIPADCQSFQTAPEIKEIKKEKRLERFWSIGTILTYSALLIIQCVVFNQSLEFMWKATSIISFVVLWFAIAALVVFAVRTVNALRQQSEQVLSYNPPIRRMALLVSGLLLCGSMFVHPSLLSRWISMRALTFVSDSVTFEDVVCIVPPFWWYEVRRSPFANGTDALLYLDPVPGSSRTHGWASTLDLIHWLSLAGYYLVYMFVREHYGFHRERWVMAMFHHIRNSFALEF